MNRGSHIDKLLLSLHESTKAILFVRHIEKHLEKLFPNQNAKVMCKICEKTIDEIYEEEA